MKNKLIKKILFVYISFFIYNIANAKPAATTVYGDCNSSDPKKQFKSKTFIDTDNNGKADMVYTVWCNGKEGMSPVKVIIGNYPIDFDIEITSFSSIGNQISFTSDIISNGNVVGNEIKYLNNDTVYSTFTIQGINKDYNEELKQLVESIEVNYNTKLNIIEVENPQLLNKKIIVKLYNNKTKVISNTKLFEATEIKKVAFDFNNQNIKDFEIQVELIDERITISYPIVK